MQARLFIPRKPKMFWLFCFVTPFLFLSTVSWAAPDIKTWTNTADWAARTDAKNITWTDVQGQIQVIKNPPKSKQTPFIYIPNSESGTVTQLDTKTGKLNWTFKLDTISHLTGVRKGRTNPSRTTVDGNGHVWVALRGKKIGESSVVVHISMQGKLIRVVKTGRLPRAISIDLKGNVWVGNWADSTLVKLNGQTGKILLRIKNVPCPYGAVADIKNNIWVVNNCRWNNTNTLMKFDQNGKVLGKYPAPGAYGIATDTQGQVWTANWPGRCLHRFTNAGSNLGCIPLGANPRGVAVDGKGQIWVPCSHVGRSETRMLIRLSSTGSITGKYTSVGVHSIGAAIDADGFVWTISYRQNMAVKMRVTDGKVIGRYPVGGVGPYTYSDMTGFAFQSLANPAQGYWRGAHSTKCLSTWKSISWKGVAPSGTSISVRARSGSTRAALSRAKWSAPLTSGGRPNIPDNRYIEVEVSMRTKDATITPYVTEVTVSSVPGGKEICNGVDDDCDGLVDNVPGTNKPITRPCRTACGSGIKPCVVGDWGLCSAPYPTPEVCDGKDNDCDGKTDEGTTCGGSSLCYKGGCATPCVSECSSGMRCTKIQNKYVCIGTKPCAQLEATCKQQGKVCRNGRCVTHCHGIQCPTSYVCEKGLCVKNDCYSKKNACPTGQICQQGRCMPHPCAGRNCSDGQFCRAGSCVKSCAGVQCPPGQSCDAGKCKGDPCAGVRCNGGQVCAYGKCIGDPCASVACRPGQSCTHGRCIDNPCRSVQCPIGQSCRGGNCYGSSQPKENPGGGSGEGGFGPQPDGGTVPGAEGSPGSDNSSIPHNKDIDQGDSQKGKPDSSPGRRSGDGCLCSSTSGKRGFGTFLLFFFGVFSILLVLKRRQKSNSL